jgi:hypothetical protein
MKNNATLINTSRGEIVNETELIEFLDSNKSLIFSNFKTFGMLAMFTVVSRLEKKLNSILNLLNIPEYMVLIISEHQLYKQKLLLVSKLTE